MRFTQDRIRDPISSQPEDVPEMKTANGATEDAANLVLRFIESIGGVSVEMTNMVIEVRSDTEASTALCSCCPSYSS